jgi:hypothetical protein
MHRSKKASLFDHLVGEGQKIHQQFKNEIVVRLLLLAGQMFKFVSHPRERRSRAGRPATALRLLLPVGISDFGRRRLIDNISRGVPVGLLSQTQVGFC